MIFLINPPVSPKAPFPNKIQSGLACLKKYIFQFGYRSKIIDLDSEEEIYSAISQIAKENSKNIFCFTALTYQIKNALKINNFLKKRFPHSFSIFGGACVTGLGKELLKNNKNIDFIVMGEGEKSFLKLLEHLFKNKDISEIPSIIYQNNNKIMENRFKELLGEKDLYLPDNSDFKDNNIFYDNVFSDKTRLAVFSRGCVFNCAFCMTCKIFSTTPRYISVEKAYQFVKDSVYHDKINCFVFDDDNFLYNKKWVNDFCEKIKPLNIKFRVNASLKHIDKELLLKLKDCGLVKISIGIESIFSDCQKIIRKKIDIEKLKDIIKFSKKKNILIALLFISALPFDDYKRSLKTIELINTLDPNGGFDFQVFQPHPGTFDMKTLDKYGKLLTRDFDEFFSDNVVYLPNKLTQEEIFNFFNKYLNKEIKITGEKDLSIKKILKEESQCTYIDPENFNGYFDSLCTHWQGSKRCKSGLSIIKCQFKGLLEYNFKITDIKNENYKLIFRTASHIDGFPKGKDYESEVNLIINNFTITKFYSPSIHTTGILKIISIDRENLNPGFNQMAFEVQNNGFSIFNKALNPFFKKYETGILLIPESLFNKHFSLFTKFLSN